VSAVGQLAIKPELPTGFPGIDAAFTDDNACLRWCDAWQSDECIGGEQKRLNDVWLQFLQRGSQSEDCGRIKATSFVQDMYGYGGLLQLLFVGATAIEGEDVGIDVSSRQAAGQCGQLAFSAGLVEGRDNKGDA
jgi:hypothetical protein